MQLVGTVFNPRRDEDNEQTFEATLEVEGTDTETAFNQKVEQIKTELFKQDQGWILWELQQESS